VKHILKLSPSIIDIGLEYYTNFYVWQQKVVEMPVEVIHEVLIQDKVAVAQAIQLIFSPLLQLPTLTKEL